MGHVLAILRPTGRASRIVAAAVMRRSLLELNLAMAAGDVSILRIRIRTNMLLVLAILRSAGRTCDIVAAAVVRFALLILNSAMGAGYVFIRILIRRNGTRMSIMDLTPLRPAARTGDITAARTVVLLVLTKILLAMTAFCKDTPAGMVSLVLAILRPAMGTGCIAASAVMRPAFQIQCSAMIASHV